MRWLGIFLRRGEKKELKILDMNWQPKEHRRNDKLNVFVVNVRTFIELWSFRRFLFPLFCSLTFIAFAALKNTFVMGQYLMKKNKSEKVFKIDPIHWTKV